MTEFTQKINGVWAEENRRRSGSDSDSSSGSEKVQLPSVRALASRYNSLAQQSGIVVRGFVKPSAAASPPVKQVAKPAPAVVALVKAPPPSAKVVESKAHKSSSSSVEAAPQAPKPAFVNDKPRPSVTTDTDDEVFETKKTSTKTEAPAHFAKKPPSGEPKQKTGFSTFPSRSPAKKWNSLSDLHSESSPKQRSDSVSSTTIFGVSLRRLDSISWGVTQARRSTANDDSDSSSDEESRTSSPVADKPDAASKVINQKQSPVPDKPGAASKVINQTQSSVADKSDAASKINTFPKNRPVESVPDKKRTGGGVKGKINQKMGNKEETKYHSYSDLSTAGVEVGATWPRRVAVGDASHQPLTRRQSISDLLKLYRSKSQSDISQATDLKPPPSPKFETFSRPRTPVPTPLTMYDLKITNPMEKAKVSPFKIPTKDIVRLPPGSASIAPKKPTLVLEPVPSKDLSQKNNAIADKDIPKVASVPVKETPIQLEKSTATKTTPSETKSSITASASPIPPKSPLASLNETTIVVKTTVVKTLSSSSNSNSDSASEAAPKLEKIVHHRKAVYQPPPKHFNRPFINQTQNAARPNGTIVRKPEPKQKVSSAQSLSRLYTPISYGGGSAPLSKNSVEKTDQRRSSASSEEETTFKPMIQKKLENKQPEKEASPVTSLIKSLNEMKTKPTFPTKPDALKPKPQDPVWEQKVNTVSQNVIVPQSNTINTNTMVSSKPLNDRDKLGRKVSSASSATSDDVDGIPHDEKSSSFIGLTKDVSLTAKKLTFNVPTTPPNTPSGRPSMSKKLDKLSVQDSLNSWAKEVSKKDSASSGESSDEDDQTPEETTGSYDFTTGRSATPTLPTSVNKDAVDNVVLIKHKAISEKNSALPQTAVKQSLFSNKNSTIVTGELKGESLPATVSVKKTVKTVERRLSSSSDDGPKKSQPKLPTPVPNNRRPQPIHQQNNIDQQSKNVVIVTSVEKKNSKSLSSRQDSVNRKSVSSGNSSSGETSTSFKEIDPYAIGRMIVRGARKSDSAVKKPENLTNIRNASVPSHSPFSPLKSTGNKIDGVNASPKPKLQRDNSSSDDAKSSSKPKTPNANSSSTEQGKYKLTKTKRGNFVRQSLSASSDLDSSDGEKGGLEISIEHDSDHSDGVYSANVAFIE